MSKNSTVPAYLVLVAQLLEQCSDVGVEPIRAATPSTLPENKGYVFLRFGSDQAAALIIPKATAEVKLCDIHVDCSDLPGWVPLKKENGRVMGHIAPATADLKQIVERLIGASKRPVKRASAAASQATPDMDSFLATLATLGKPKAAQAPASQPVEEPATLADMPEDIADLVDSL